MGIVSLFAKANLKPGSLQAGIELRMMTLRAAQILVLFLCCCYGASASPELKSLIRCLQAVGVLNVTTPQHSQANSYYSLLDASRQNMRFAEPSVPKPSGIIFPSTGEDVRKSFLCCVKGNWTVRVRSGGHSFEGLSYTADSPFVIIDFLSMQAVKVDLESKTAWVEAGANLGQLYESIAQTTSEYGFSAGSSCPSVGVGGQFSGGGYGFLSRMYGVAADHVIDVRLVNAKGELLDRRGMGEDYFWAVRGGGGGSWGIVVEWKVKLLPVPSKVTWFSLVRYGKEEVERLVYRWQDVAPFAPRELQITMDLTANMSKGNATAQVTAIGWNLDTLEETVLLLEKLFPELGLAATDCQEGRWIDAVAAIAGAATPEALMGRYNRYKSKFKGKSDYVTKAVPKAAWGAVVRLLEEGPPNAFVYLWPYGGAMAEISSDAIAFPHRSGNLYVVQYQVIWGNQTDDAIPMAWIRRIYRYMTPYVSKSPRAAYVNYIDLDLGVGGEGRGPAAVAQAAASWGPRYFAGNFHRLVHVKTVVDPLNVFNHPQGIPPLTI